MSSAAHGRFSSGTGGIGGPTGNGIGWGRGGTPIPATTRPATGTTGGGAGTTTRRTRPLGGIEHRVGMLDREPSREPSRGSLARGACSPAWLDATPKSSANLGLLNNLRWLVRCRESPPSVEVPMKVRTLLIPALVFGAAIPIPERPYECAEQQEPPWARRLARARTAGRPEPTVIGVNTTRVDFDRQARRRPRRILATDGFEESELIDDTSSPGGSGSHHRDRVDARRRNPSYKHDVKGNG